MKVVGLGAGGHAKVIIEILQSVTDLEIVGLLDPNEKLWGKRVLNVPILGSDDLLSSLQSEGIENVFIGVGGNGNTRPRKELYEKALAVHFKILSAIHPSAMISPSVRIGHGVNIFAGVVINSQTVVGDNVIVNTGAILEHDCVIMSHSHIAPGARVLGGVKVMSGAHVGASATILPGLEIGEEAVVGAGAVVTCNVKSRDTVVGIPARSSSSK